MAMQSSQGSYLFLVGGLYPLNSRLHPMHCFHTLILLLKGWTRLGKEP